MKKYKVSFTGRQAGAIGIIYKINDTYKLDSLGKLLYALYTDYDLIRELRIWENSRELDKETISEIKMIEFDYPKRERSPRTGSYKYTREDCPTGYDY